MNHHVRFHSAGYRKATCMVCGALVNKHHVSRHAIFHVNRGEGREAQRGGHTAHNDVAVVAMEDGPVAIESGWVTDSPGPR